MKKRTLFLGLFISALSIGFVSCDKDDDETPEPAAPTLYSKLGGSTMVTDPNGGMIEQGRLGLRSVVDSTIFVIAGDENLSPYFEQLLTEFTNGNATNVAILSKNLTDFFCVATGAENFTYSGTDMVTAHDPAQNPRMKMKTDDADFTNFIGAVGTGATQVGVPAELIGEVAALIETLRSDVVQR